jgi:hypothetical protein
VLCNFRRIPETPRVTPTGESGIVNHVWTIPGLLQSVWAVSVEAESAESRFFRGLAADALLQQQQLRGTWANCASSGLHPVTPCDLHSP